MKSYITLGLPLPASVPLHRAEVPSAIEDNTMDCSCCGLIQNTQVTYSNISTAP